MRSKLNLAIHLIFVTGLCIVIYSVFQIISGNQQVKNKLVEAEELINPPQEVAAAPPETEDDFLTIDEIAFSQESVSYPPMDLENLSFQLGEVIGILHVPKLNEDLPIVEGTTNASLKLGVGHYEGTAFPLQNEQIVLSGHNNTVFRNFDKLEIGDSFVLKLSYGTFEYEIYETEIVHKDDRTVIRPRGEEILTVTTCYPFNVLGSPDRFIFYAKPVKIENVSSK